MLVLAPSSVQEAIDIMMFAFEKAEKYRMPVLFLADGTYNDYSKYLSDKEKEA